MKYTKWGWSNSRFYQFFHNFLSHKKINSDPKFVQKEGQKSHKNLNYSHPTKNIYIITLQMDKGGQDIINTSNAKFSHT